MEHTDGQPEHAPDIDVHICVVRAGEPLYVPDTVNQALGLAGGGSYALVRINDMVVIAPQGAGLLSACPTLDRVVRAEDLAHVLAHVDTLRSRLVE